MRPTFNIYLKLRSMEEKYAAEGYDPLLGPLIGPRTDTCRHVLRFQFSATRSGKALHPSRTGHSQDPQATVPP